MKEEVKGNNSSKKLNHVFFLFNRIKHPVVIQRHKFLNNFSSLAFLVAYFTFTQIFIPSCLICMTTTTLLTFSLPSLVLLLLLPTFIFLFSISKCWHFIYSLLLLKKKEQKKSLQYCCFSNQNNSNSEQKSNENSDV